MTHAVSWMNLEHIMLSELSQPLKDGYSMVHLYDVSRVVKVIETENRMVRNWGKEEMGSYRVMGTEFPFGKIF